MKNTRDQNCEICYKIICASCGWKAKDADVLLIQKQEMTSCPVCNWAPKQSIL